MPFAVRRANWIQRGAIVLLAIWLMLEVPVVCHQGPMSLFDLGAHKGHMQPGFGLVGHGEAAAGLQPGRSNPTSMEMASRLIMMSQEHGLLAAAALGTMVSISEGTLPIHDVLPPLGIELALVVAFLLLYKLLPLSPPEQPPRPLVASSLA